MVAFSSDDPSLKPVVFFLKNLFLIRTKTNKKLPGLALFKIKPICSYVSAWLLPVVVERLLSGDMHQLLAEGLRIQQWTASTHRLEILYVS